MVKLRLGFATDVPIVTKRCSEVMKLEMRIYHKSFKVVEFLMELHHGSFKGGKTILVKKQSSATISIAT